MRDRIRPLLPYLLALGVCIAIKRGLPRDLRLWSPAIIAVVWLMIVSWRSPARWLAVSTAGTFLYFLGPGYLLAQKVAQLGGRPPSLAESIGQSSYLGYETSMGFNVFAANLVGLFLFLVLGITLFSRRAFAKNSSTEAETLDPTRILNRRRIAGVAGLALIASAINMPDFSGAMSNIQNHPQFNEFDSRNLRIWQYMAFGGFLPFRDYWFPYGGQWDQMSPFPSDLLRAWFHETGISFFSAFGIYFLTGGSLGWILGIATFLFAANAEQYVFEQMWRYNTALSALIWSLGILKLGKYASQWLFAVTGLCWFWVFEFEPNQFLFTFIPLVACAVPQRKHLNRGWTVAFAVFFATLISYFGLLYRDGQFGSFVEFYRTLSAISSYAILPQDIVEWSRISPPTSNRWSVLLISGLLCIGALQLIRSLLNQQLSFQINFALAFGILSLALFSKQMIRGPMAKQTLGYLIPGAIFFGFAWFKMLEGRARLYSKYVLVGILAITLTYSTVRETLAQRLRTFRRLPEHFKVLTMGNDELEIAREGYYGDKVFLEGDPALQPLRDRLVEILKGTPNRKFYVLGDDASLYLLLDQQPPEYLNYYNSTPRVAQESIVRTLGDSQVEWIVWGGIDRGMNDAVPPPIRLPIVFRYVVRNFEKGQQAGVFQLLRRKTNHGEPNWKFWKEQLGETIDLKHVAAFSIGKSRRSCQGAADCIPYLLIRCIEVKEGEVAVPLEVSGHRFAVKFSRHKGVREFGVRLDRLWFWEPAATIGAPDSADCSVVREDRVGDRDFLY